MRTVSKATLLAGSASTALLVAGPWPNDAQAQEVAVGGGSTPGMFNWTGVYFGVQGGGIWSDQDKPNFGECGPFTDLVDDDGDPISSTVTNCQVGDVDDDDSPSFPTELPYLDLDDDYVAYTGGRSSRDDFSGILGGHVGFAGQIGGLVIGLEGDISGVFDGDRSREVGFEYFESIDELACLLGDCDLENYDGTGTVRATSNLEWLSTIRARVGGALGHDGRFLLYWTGGLALAGLDNSIDTDFNEDGAIGWCDDCTFGDADEGDDLQIGFTIGGGTDYALTNHLSMGFEYLFTHFEDGDDQTVTFFADSGRRFDVNLGDTSLDNLHLFRARMSYRLGGPPAP